MNACLVDDPWVARVRQDLDVHSELLAGEGALQEEAAKKREKDVRCLKPKHNCKFKIFTPGYYYDAANDLCVFTIQTGCPKVSNGCWPVCMNVPVMVFFVHSSESGTSSTVSRNVRRLVKTTNR